MKHILKISLIIIALTNSFAQKIIVKSNQQNDTLILCPNQQFFLYAYLISHNGDTLNAYWTWFLGDGTTFTGNNLDTIKYAYSQSGGYRILIQATYQDTSIYAVKLAKVGLKPFFTGTKPDLDPKQIGICNGDEITLIGKASEVRQWTESKNNKYLEPIPFEISKNIPYQNSILLLDLNPDTTLTSDNLIDSIAILIMHPNSSEIKITLTAPNGNSIILKDYGGNPNYFGNPQLAQNGALWYYWAPNASQTINSLSISNQQIPNSNSYLPDQTFSNLLGTPLNGYWTITIQDSATDNNGYILGWAIYFDSSVVADTFKFSNQYYINRSYWYGNNVNITTNGTATAYPQGYGSHAYKFYIPDNFGCYYDTTIHVIVEQPDFSIDKQNLVIGDSVRVENQTSWAKDIYWDFGDGSPLQENNPQYHKYLEKGTFTITLTAISESGCQDFDTASVTVQPQPIKIQNYNVFTPNGDGINDVFNFFNNPDEKIIADNIATIDGKIYDRYGNLIYQWSSPEEIKKGWDGTILNSKTPAPEGFYFYILKIRGKDDKDYVFSGFIYLHR